MSKRVSLRGRIMFLLGCAFLSACADLRPEGNSSPECSGGTHQPDWALHQRNSLMYITTQGGGRISEASQESLFNLPVGRTEFGIFRTTYTDHTIIPLADPRDGNWIPTIRTTPATTYFLSRKPDWSTVSSTRVLHRYGGEEIEGPLICTHGREIYTK